MGSKKWERRRNKEEMVVMEDPSTPVKTWSAKRSRTGTKKTRAERARRKNGVASTNKRLGNKAKAAPSGSIRGQSSQPRKGRPKRPQPSGSRR